MFVADVYDENGIRGRRVFWWTEPDQDEQRGVIRYYKTHPEDPEFTKLWPYGESRHTLYNFERLGDLMASWLEMGERIVPVSVPQDFDYRAESMKDEAY